MLLLIGAISGKAQSLAQLKGNYEGVYDNRYCSLSLDPTENSIQSSGYLSCDDNSFDIKATTEMKDIKCKGTLELYFGGYMTFNVLHVSEGDEIDPTQMIIAGMYYNSPDDLICVRLDSTDGGKTLTLTCMDDEDDPLFGVIKLKRSK